MNEKAQFICEAIIMAIITILFIWGFLTGPQGWGWQAFAWLVGIE